MPQMTLFTLRCITFVCERRLYVSNFKNSMLSNDIEGIDLSCGVRYSFAHSSFCCFSHLSGYVLIALSIEEPHCCGVEIGNLYTFFL